MASLDDRARAFIGPTLLVSFCVATAAFGTDGRRNKVTRTLPKRCSPHVAQSLPGRSQRTPHSDPKVCRAVVRKVSKRCQRRWGSRPNVDPTWPIRANLWPKLTPSFGQLGPPLVEATRRRPILGRPRPNFSQVPEHLADVRYNLTKHGPGICQLRPRSTSFGRGLPRRVNFIGRVGSILGRISPPTATVRKFPGVCATALG